MKRLYRITIESDCDRMHRETYVLRASSADAAWDIAVEDDENVMAGWIPVAVEPLPQS